MSHEFRNRKLVSISTLWEVVFEAHNNPSEAARLAQQQILNRYGAAVRNYMLKSLRNEEAANELYQEFVLCLLRGDYRNPILVTRIYVVCSSFLRNEFPAFPSRLRAAHSEPSVAR